ncbi:hypothetical protein [Gloeobacter kilaueensis]|uniref:Uncharacterized protein n=1 Tax=Gloeobacter kilaueensis (strain ATCC BAA-2537 / CCAP 1431/1 / ULC 316 / JS1) TaxID=1183438 RepID=U5QNT4_GLOK1|nr:hypothetical protein [Gloeobacter kilaueensis]AGY59259.1 hypothetical protein GKIL_3013 [Gloeobacter kilaueensis JS1]
MDERTKKLLGGALIAAIGVGFIGWSWYNRQSQGSFYIRTSIFGPAALVLGLALLFVPGYREERRGRGEDISALSGLQLVTARWWFILALALALGLLNLFLLTYL